MCEPVTIMYGIGIALAGVQAYSASQTAKAQRQQTEVQAANERSEAHETAEENLGIKVREAREARARARVAAGESGALGASFAASINQSLQDQDNQAALISKGLAFTQRGIDDRANTALAGMQGPSALEAGLSIANAGMGAYNSASANQAAIKAGKVTPTRHGTGN